MNISRSIYDPYTGETILIIEEDDGDGYRNAGRDHRGGGVRTVFQRPSRSTFDRPPVGGGIPPRAHERADVVRHHTSQTPQHQPQQTGGTVQHSSEYVAIRKAALVEIIPTLGQVWASFLGRPDMPPAVGDDVIDRDNASLHRDALAMHSQNQTRILALSDLAARAVRLLAA